MSDSAIPTPNDESVTPSRYTIPISEALRQKSAIPLSYTSPMQAMAKVRLQFLGKKAAKALWIGSAINLGLITCFGSFLLAIAANPPVPVLQLMAGQGQSPEMITLGMRIVAGLMFLVLGLPSLLNLLVGFGVRQGNLAATIVSLISVAGPGLLVFGYVAINFLVVIAMGDLAGAVVTGIMALLLVTPSAIMLQRLVQLLIFQIKLRRNKGV